MQRRGWVALSLCLACGGNGNSAPAGSGVKGSLVLSKLTASQRTAVCKASIELAYSRPMIDENCTLEASYETESLAECKAYKDECVAELNEKLDAHRQDDLDDCESLDDDEYLNCEYTVEEYERCDRESELGWERAAREASCLDAGELGPEDDTVDLSAKCDDVLDACYIQ